MRTVRLVHVIFLNLITLIIFGEEYNYGTHYAVISNVLLLPPS